MRCAKCQKQLPQTDHHSGVMLSVAAGSLLVGGVSYVLAPGNSVLPLVAVGMWPDCICKCSPEKYLHLFCKCY